MDATSAGVVEGTTPVEAGGFAFMVAPAEWLPCGEVGARTEPAAQAGSRGGTSSSVCDDRIVGGADPTPDGSAVAREPLVLRFERATSPRTIAAASAPV